MSERDVIAEIYQLANQAIQSSGGSRNPLWVNSTDPLFRALKQIREVAHAFVELPVRSDGQSKKHRWVWSTADDGRAKCKCCSIQRKEKRGGGPRGGYVTLFNVSNEWTATMPICKGRSA